MMSFRSVGIYLKILQKLSGYFTYVQYDRRIDVIPTEGRSLFKLSATLYGILHYVQDDRGVNVIPTKGRNLINIVGMLHCVQDDRRTFIHSVSILKTIWR